MTMTYIGIAAGLALGLLVVSLMNRAAKSGTKFANTGANKGIAEPVPGKGTMQEIDYYLRKGQKIQAIKAYREQHGCGLKEAKEAVDKLERR